MPLDWAREAVDVSRRHTQLFRQWLRPCARRLEWDYEDLFVGSNGGSEVSAALVRRLSALLDRPLQPGPVTLKKLSHDLAGEVGNYCVLRRALGG